MSSGIQWDATVRQQLATRGVDESTGVYGGHKVKIGKGSPIRLDEIKSAQVPYAGYHTVQKVARGKAGIQQCAQKTLQALSTASGKADFKELLGQLKAMQTHYERLGALGLLSAAQKESTGWMFASALKGLSNAQLAAVFQSFTTSEMDLLQTALMREGQINTKNADAAQAAEKLFDLQAMVIKEINDRSINAQIDDAIAASPKNTLTLEASRPQSMADPFSGLEGAGLQTLQNGTGDISAANLHILTEVGSSAQHQREVNSAKEQARLQARDLGNVTVKQMADVLRSAELTVNIQTEHLIGGDNSIFDHPDDPLVNIFHLSDQGIKPHGESYNTLRDNVEKKFFPEFGGHAIKADERPVYGALNLGKRKVGAIGSATGYGSSAIVLKPHVAKRATYIMDDTFLGGKIAITPERRENFFKLLDGSGLPAEIIRGLKDPGSQMRRDLDAYLDKIAGEPDGSTAMLDLEKMPESLSSAVFSNIHPRDAEHIMKALLTECFMDAESTRSIMATHDNLETLISNMNDVDGNSLALAAQKKNSVDGRVCLIGAQYIEAQIQGPVIPSRDIAEIRIDMNDVDDDQKPLLRERAKQYAKATGIKVTLLENYDEGLDELHLSDVMKARDTYNAQHVDTAAVERLKNEYLQDFSGKVRELLQNDNFLQLELDGLPREKMQLEGNALGKAAGDFLKELDTSLKSEKQTQQADVLVRQAFMDVIIKTFKPKAALMRELDALAAEEPPMSAAQKDAFIKWIMSSKALRSPEELRIITRHAKAQAQLLREIADAEPPLPPDQIFRRLATLGTGINSDVDAFMKTLPPDEDFGTDEKTNEMDRISFMSLALVQHGEPPMDKAALEKLNDRLAGPEMSAFLGQLEALIRDNGMEKMQGFAVLSQLKTQIWLNAVNIGALAGRRFPDPAPFAGEFSLLQEPLRSALREAVPDIAQKLDAEHPAYAPMPAPAHPQAMPQNEAQRRAFCVKAMDSYMDIEKVHEKGRSVHGRGHIARSYIFANVMCNMLEEAGVKIDKNAVQLSIAGHDMGRQGPGYDKWEEDSAEKTVDAMRSTYGQDAMGQDYEQHIAGCINHKSPQNNTLEAMVMQAADSLDIGRTKDFDLEQFPFLKGKPGEAPGEEAKKVRDELAREADLLQRLTNPYCANRQVLFRMMNDAGQAPTKEIAMYFQKQSEELQQKIAGEFERDFTVGSEEYMTRFEDTIRKNPKMFPLLSKYYH